MNYEEFKEHYPELADHEWKSADDSCPWNPTCDRGRAYILGYLNRAEINRRNKALVEDKYKCKDYGHAGPKCGADDCWLRNE